MASLRSGVDLGRQEDEEVDNTNVKAGDSVVPRPKGSLCLIKPLPRLVVLDLDKTVSPRVIVSISIARATILATVLYAKKIVYWYIQQRFVCWVAISGVEKSG